MLNKLLFTLYKNTYKKQILSPYNVNLYDPSTSMTVNDDDDGGLRSAERDYLIFLP